MDIDITTTYTVVAKDLEPGMVLQLHGTTPAEIESADKRDPDLVEIFFTEPHAIFGTLFTYRSLLVRPDVMLTRFHENR